jgi:UDP-GlcNAc3NAcA epimerase
MPEEINRIVTDHLATIQLCPTYASIQNLEREGITQNVHHTGDVMYDATLFAVRSVKGRTDIREKFGLSNGPYSICTIHRAENTDDPERLGRVCDYLSGVAGEIQLVLPLHPRTREALARHHLSLAPAVITEPLGYFDLHALIAGAEMVYTDSGGLQKEAYFHGKRCITLRDETEWIETVEHGWNRLWQGGEFIEPCKPIQEYGGGNAADAVVRALIDFLG